MTVHSASTVAGVIGGTLSSIFAALQLQNITETVVLSVIGSVVSFAVSLIIEWVRRKLRSR